MVYLINYLPSWIIDSEPSVEYILVIKMSNFLAGDSFTHIFTMPVVAVLVVRAQPQPVVAGRARREKIRSSVLFAAYVCST
jgi:hypothetical protein